MQKILIIRFSSIGDIVLTSPIIRCLKTQTNTQVHFLMKEKYLSTLEFNPYIDKIITLKDNFQETLSILKKEDYHLIIDLQNSIRSFWIKFNLRVRSFTVKKKNWAKFLYINFGKNMLQDHVVDRYFETIKTMGIINDNKGLEYFVRDDADYVNLFSSMNFNVNQKFIAWSIGGSYYQKRLSKIQITNVCNHLNTPIVLLGGKDDFEVGSEITTGSKHKRIYNFCGSISLDTSAYLINKSALVLTNDTGLMHIASAFKKEIISFWGCTKPPLGFSPYMSSESSREIIYNPSRRPCSKHGRFCSITSEGCVKKISPSIIIEAINNSQSI